jgi:hypothetical protein
MKFMSIIILMTTVFASTQALASDVSLFAASHITENEQRAVALVKAKYMFSADADTAQYAIEPSTSHDDLNVTVQRSSTGGACPVPVRFNDDGTIVVGNADCDKEI